MRKQIEHRLEILKGDFARGQANLSELENTCLKLRETLLKISGAIQVLEELVKDANSTVDAQADTAGEKTVTE